MYLSVSDCLLRRPDGSSLLQIPELAVDSGQVVAIVGPSGSGKTSLLNCIAGLSRPASGRIVIADTDVPTLSGGDAARFRRDEIGVLFQFGELLPELSVVENVALPARLAGTIRKDAIEQARTSLSTVGLAGFADRDPTTLSGGETQRVALARALARHPGLLLADEPTGMLDEQNTSTIIQLIVDVCRDNSIAGVVVTHDRSVARRCGAVYRVHDGELIPVSVAEVSVAEAVG